MRARGLTREGSHLCYPAAVSHRRFSWLFVVTSALLLVARGAWAGPPDPPEASESPIPPKPLGPLTYDYPTALLELDDPPAGIVTIRYVVGIDGVPFEVELLEGVDPAIDEVALASVAALRFEPASFAGEPIEVVLTIELAFTPPVREVDEPDVDEPDVDEPDVDEPDVDEPEQDGPIRIEGVILEAGEGIPVGGATLLAIPAGDLPLGRVRTAPDDDASEPAWLRRTVSDGEGRFALRGVPSGRVRLILIAPAFERLEWVVELGDDEALTTKYFMTRTVSGGYRTEVSVERETMPEVISRTLTPKQLAEIPGTQGDALKAVQNFPSVARAPFGAGALVIRGAAPGDSGVFLGYHEIPTLFHFGGLTSVFNSDILAQIDFVPGNFDSRYGDVTGGIVNVQPRKGRRDGYHGYVDVDLFDTGVLAEGPIGKGSFVLSGRRSYIDLLLPLVIPDEVGLGLTLAPRYWDYQALFDYPLGGGEFSLRVFGSDDRSKLLFAAENDADADDRSRLETTQWFHRVDAVYRKVEGPWEFLITPSYKRELFAGRIFGNIDFRVESDTFSARSELSRRLTSHARLRVGAELTATWYRGRALVPPLGDDAAGSNAGDLRVRETNPVRVIPGLYSTLTLKLGERATLFPGVRLNYYNGPQNKFAVDPRLRFLVDLGATTALKGGLGLYTQGPGPQQSDAQLGNPHSRLERSAHASLAIEQQLPWDVSIEVTGFYKHLWDLLSPSAVLRFDPNATSPEPRPEIFANTGTGEVYGGELLIQKLLGDNFYGWLSYTLMRSVRTPAPDQTQRLFDFDQTHILTLIASYEFPLHWRVGLRFRVVSGNPYTPITDGAFDATTGDQLAILGPVNGARLPTFHQLDLRVDKTWVYRRVRVTAYLDVQNVYNAQNIEFLNYAYHYRVTSPIYSLPTAPSLGTKIEF
jgi:hypothetical protein